MKITVPALATMAVLTLPAPAAVSPKAPNLVGAVIAALVVVPAVVLRHRRWAPRLGAALLAGLAVAAVAPLAGVGAPSEEEFQHELAIAYALGGLAGARAYVRMWSLPWDADDLVLLALACLAAAALLLALGGAVREEGRRELPPLRWRWPLALWSAALVLVSVPRAMFLAARADGPIQHSIMVIDGACFGGAEKLMSGTALLALIPPPIVVASGFGLWALLTLVGERPLGRVVGGLTVVPLVAGDIMTTWLPVLGCARPWEEAADLLTLSWVLFGPLPVVLILLAVRARRALAPDVRPAV
ncbi:hypothetical protein [Nonomuraea aridisoli]|uniref:Uncharacterized protein n=1 Tax=Nonomuraea aridisoli TaxID=2070368 RepID=A0A2W2DPR2_9ACTN|nr:hypothetical protein [Nonomuraea aridisoli]PZG12633.1 hypothetical protein C1J01_32205 [Nonomuraea aridisoli]